MAYAQLKTDIAAVIRNNGNQEITGNVLQGALLEMINALGANYQYAGVADTSTTITTTEANVFYLLTEAGTYANMSSSIVHTSGIGIALWNGSAWSYQNVPSSAVVATDATPTENSTNPVQSGGVYDAIKTHIVKGTDTDFLQLDENYNLIDLDECVANKYIKGTDGTEVSATNLYATPFVPLKPSTTYLTSGTILARYLAYYDENKTYVSGDNTTTGYLSTFTTPANIAYGRFSFPNESLKNQGWISVHQLTSTEYKYVRNEKLSQYVELSAEELTDVSMFDYGNIIDRSKITIGYYISNAANSYGQAKSANGYACTDFCEVDESKSYTFYKIFNFYAGFYDADKNCLKVYTTSERLPNPFTPPVGAKYARFSIDTTITGSSDRHQYDVCWVAANSQNVTPNEFKSYTLPQHLSTSAENGSFNPCDYNGTEFAMFNKLMCVGDSLTFGAENVQSGTLPASQMTLYSYPSILAKLSGVTITNKGHSGLTAQQWYEQHSSDTDLSGHDSCIIFIGINDWLSWQSDTDSGIETFKQYLGEIVDLVLAQNSALVSGTYKNPIKIFVSTAPPIFSYLKNSLGTSVDVLNEAIREFVESRTDCILLDMALYSHTNEKWAYHRGHLTPVGYWRLAKDYYGIVGKYIHDNLDLFVNLAFVGSSATQYTYSATQW